jgi:hypothetical protein
VATQVLVWIAANAYPPSVLFHASNALTLIIAGTLVVAFVRALKILALTKMAWVAGHTFAAGICTEWFGLVLRQISFYLPPSASPGTVPKDEFLSVVHFPMWLFGMSLMLLGGVIVLVALFQKEALE